MGPQDKEQFVNDWFEDALKRYGEAEPRPGLENRVLTAVRTERERRMTRKRSWWPALAAVTAILTIAVGVYLARWDGRKEHSPIARENIGSVEVSGSQPNPAIAPRIREATNQRHSGARGGLHSVHASASRRLNQFPSPEPLSEQEQILARYVQQFPHEADLTAQFQAEFAYQEMLAEQSPPESEISSSSEAQNQ